MCAYVRVCEGHTDRSIRPCLSIYLVPCPHTLHPAWHTCGGHADRSRPSTFTHTVHPPPPLTHTTQHTCRILVGPLVDFYGPKVSMTWLLLIGAVPFFFAPLVTGWRGLIALRCVLVLINHIITYHMCPPSCQPPRLPVAADQSLGQSVHPHPHPPSTPNTRTHLPNPLQTKHPQSLTPNPTSAGRASACSAPPSSCPRPGPPACSSAGSWGGPTRSRRGGATSVSHEGRRKKEVRSAEWGGGGGGGGGGGKSIRIIVDDERRSVHPSSAASYQAAEAIHGSIVHPPIRTHTDTHTRD